MRDVSPELAHCSTERRHELLGQTQFFSQLDETGIDRVNELFREVHYSQGDWVFRQGDPAAEMFVVAAGQVKLLQHGAEGKDVLFELAAAGDLIGATAAIGNTTYADAAQAHTDTCLLRIASKDFQSLLQEEPGIALKVLAFAGAQLEQARSQVQGLTSATAEQRLARTLLKLADRHGEQGEDGVLIQLPLPQQDLAAMTGTTVETVSRILGQFRRDGLIASGRRWVAVSDLTRLASLAADPS